MTTPQLALISISDHYTRSKLQAPAEATAGAGAGDEESHVVGVTDPRTGLRRALGVLFGVQVDTKMHVHYSYELKCKAVDGVIVFDEAHLQRQIELSECRRRSSALGDGQAPHARAHTHACMHESHTVSTLTRQPHECPTHHASTVTVVYPTYELVGWYATGSEVVEDDLRLHTAMSAVAPSPLFLLLNPEFGADAKELSQAITVYEAHVQLEEGIPRQVFVSTPFEVGAMESERVTVDHISKVARAETAPKGSSALHPTFMNAKEAIHMLEERIDVLVAFLEATRDGKIPTDHALLRQVAAICAAIPTAKSDKFRKDFSSEYNDSMLVTYLATLTKGAKVLNEVTEKVTVGFEKRVGGHGRSYHGM